MKRILCAAAAMILLLAAGCNTVDNTPVPSAQDTPAKENSGGAARPAVDGERLYSFPLGNAWFSNQRWLIDKDGNEVIQEDTPGYTETELTDLATGETRYRYRTRYENTGKRDEWGNPEALTLRSLYDMDGNRLIDWEEKSYGPAFGEYIIRQDPRDGMAWAGDLTDGYRTALYHVPTGAESYEGTFGAAKLDSGDFLLTDIWQTPLGVVNSSGEVISGFPMPKTYYSAQLWNGYFIASSVHSYNPAKVDYLLDSSFRELYAFDWISGYYGNLRGDYLTYQNGGQWGVFHPERGVLFSVEDASVEYYDGELVIVQTGSFRSQDMNASLVTQDNREIAGGFSWLVPAQTYEETEPAEKFLGITGGKAVLIDRAGNELASAELPTARSLNVLCDGLYIYYDLHGNGLLGHDLTVLVPAGRYTSIGLAPGFYPGNEEWDGSAENVLLRADKELGGRSDEPGRTIYRMDVLDHTGKVIVDNVTSIYDVGPGRIALARGFEMGLMDRDGNWIAKRSIFSNLGDD